MNWNTLGWPSYLDRIRECDASVQLGDFGDAEAYEILRDIATKLISKPLATFDMRDRTGAKLIYKAWCVDPRLCQSCGRPMKIIAAIAPEQT